eukprot:SAG31_NODE_21097_length_558_cov_0.747277_1_plen_104_part_00
MVLGLGLGRRAEVQRVKPEGERFWAWAWVVALEVQRVNPEGDYRRGGWFWAWAWSRSSPKRVLRVECQRRGVGARWAGGPAAWAGPGRYMYEYQLYRLYVMVF